MKAFFYIIIGIFLVINSCNTIDNDSEKVKIYEESISIPTYLLDEPERNPIFYTPRQYQGAQLRIYPYQNLNKLSEEKVDKEYKGLFIENKYIKICVLPELGGRLYSAIDKTNEYNFIYRNNVIKPALIGMAGAWISGGVEWNIPHHHRVSTFMPVDYKLIDNDDGSKTIWVGEFEKRHQTRWIVGMTVYPDKSYIETDIRLFNTTPYEQSFLAWANAAVHANKEYQVIFPPDVERAVFHSKVEFIDFPVADQYYRGIDFRGGVDVSWWKNTTSPTSFFAWGTEMDFLAGIDHGRNAGTVLVGDHRTFIGKKFWNWGDNEVGRLWDQMLTDEDGPYLELMMGMYSDNQPDYNWNDPLDAKSGTMYFMPIRNLSSIKNANKDISVNLDFTDDSIRVEIYATGIFNNADIKLSQNDDIIFQQKADLDPANTFLKNIKSPELNKQGSYCLEVISNDGQKLLEYRPPVREDLPEPPVYRDPVEPFEIASPDDLYLAGMRLDQFGNPRYNPVKYFEEALKRDPDNLLVNTQLGIYFLKRGDDNRAEIFFRKAVDKVTHNYTTPKNAEALYYLGVVLFNQGSYEEAADWLNKASWHRNWKSPSLFLLALINSRDGNVRKAIVLAEKSVREEPDNMDGLCLLATLYRQSRQYERASEILKTALSLDPLNHWAAYESLLLKDNAEVPGIIKSAAGSFDHVFRDEADNFLEIAARYGNAGLYQDGINLLQLARNNCDNMAGNYPLLGYYLAWFYLQNKEPEEITHNTNLLEDSVRMNCFPYGNFTESVLQVLLEEFPEDAALHYYLGNLYADGQAEKAIGHWKKATNFKEDLAVAYRNMAFIQANILDETDQAIKNIERAIEINPDDPLYLTEADQYYAYELHSPEKRLEKLNIHLETAKKADRSDLRRIKLNTFMGNYEEAIESLTNRHFHIEEITDINPHEEWTDAFLVKGIDLMNKGDYKYAIESFNRVFEFPRNLEIPRDSRTGIAYFWLARCNELSGNSEKAIEHYNNMINFEAKEGWGGGRLPVLQFFTALALQKMGRQAESDKLLNNLIRVGLDNINFSPHEGLDLRSVKVRLDLRENIPQGYFMVGMGHLGKGSISIAEKNFRKVLEGKPDHLDASLFMKMDVLKYIIE